ncbi:MAG: hypothetical protein A3K18_21785 [Lentisphaerae bacterium RIFOXYA12_64_32]|nr:MAG: hypothetical protein A3K18_21785 [Lentisphaerae bacterium RIFOXYA12_64_32]
MALTVISLAAYRTRGSGWTQDEYDAAAFVHALKGEDIKNRYADIKVAGRRVRLTNANRDSALEWFGEMAADLVPPAKRGIWQLVPIPGHLCAVGADAPGRTGVLATALATQSEGRGVVLDALRWVEVVPSARRGEAPRDPDYWYDRLTFTSTQARRAVKNARCVLVDDVLTSGSHLQAAAAMLSEAGATVSRAICGGRAVQDAVDDSWERITVSLDDFTPG